MKVFLGIFAICFLVLMLTLEPILRNAWVLIAAIAAVIAALLTVLYFLMPSSFLYPTHIESGDMYSSDTLADLYSVLVLCAC